MKCIVALGSNTEAQKNLALGRNLLIKYFHNAQFAPEETTQAIGCQINLTPFLNQVCTFVSDLSIAELKTRLKTIEHASGRTPEEKLKEVIRLDIDLLAVDNEVIKPLDWERDYVKRGIRYLKEVM